MFRGAWWATVQTDAKSQTQLNQLNTREQGRSDAGGWQAIVHRVAKESDTIQQLNNNNY